MNKQESIETRIYREQQAQSAKMTPIPNYHGYFITIDGDVFSNNFHNSGRLGKLKATVNHDGYFRVTVVPNGKRKGVFVHVLMALTYIGEKPSEKHEVRHKDGNPQNNHPSNLEWSTHARNMEDVWVHRGGFNNKLTRDQVSVIRQRILNGEDDLTISKDYGVTKTCINQIKRGNVWKDVLPDASQVKRFAGSKGSAHPYSKLNEEQVVEIREMLAQGRTGSEIARSYGVNKTVVSGIKLGKTWKHVTGGIRI